MDMKEIKLKVELGRVMARFYVQAQEGVSMEVSDFICEASGKLDRWGRWGFNAVMERSPYNVRLMSPDHPSMAERESVAPVTSFFRRDAAAEAVQWLGLGTVPRELLPEDWERVGLTRADPDDEDRDSPTEYMARLPSGSIVSICHGDWIVRTLDAAGKASVTRMPDSVFRSTYAEVASYASA